MLGTKASDELLALDECPAGLHQVIDDDNVTILGVTLLLSTAQVRRQGEERGRVALHKSNPEASRNVSSYRRKLSRQRVREA